MLREREAKDARARTPKSETVMHNALRVCDQGLSKGFSAPEEVCWPRDGDTEPIYQVGMQNVPQEME